MESNRLRWLSLVDEYEPIRKNHLLKPNSSQSITRESGKGGGPLAGEAGG
jgi:hypothetical protein